MTKRKIKSSKYKYKRIKQFNLGKGNKKINVKGVKRKFSKGQKKYKYTMNVINAKDKKTRINNYVVYGKNLNSVKKRIKNALNI